jgi:hypothetical protein
MDACDNEYRVIDGAIKHEVRKSAKWRAPGVALVHRVERWVKLYPLKNGI